MRILLDTHVWLWSLVSPERIGEAARQLLEDRSNELLLSAASSWEIAIKYRLGKLSLPCPPDQFIPSRLTRDGVIPLGVEHHHATGVAALPEHHRDPFDRLLISQARLERLSLFTADRILLAYDAQVVLV